MPDLNSNQPLLPFTEEELVRSKAILVDAEKSLTFIAAVSDDAVKTSAKLDDGRESFIRDVITELTNAKGSIPTLASLQKLIIFYDSYRWAYDYEDLLKDLLLKVTRSRMVYGGKAYDQASRYYKGLDTAIKDDIEGAVESKKRLAKYFVSNGNNGGDKPNKTEAEKPK